MSQKQHSRDTKRVAAVLFVLRSCFGTPIFECKCEFVILNGVKDVVSMSVNRTQSHEILRFAQDDKLKTYTRNSVFSFFCDFQNSF